MPEVSIVLPICNAAQSLERAVESICRQRFSDWELILIDDGSEDDSPNIAEKMSAMDGRIQVITQAHKGIVAALNRSISIASAPYIARMDADDVSHPDRILKQHSFMEENTQYGLTATRVRFAGNRKEQGGYARYVDWTNSLTTWDTIRLNQFVESPFAHPSVMFRHELCQGQSGPYHQGNFPEDYELWLRWLRMGVRMAMLPETLLDWHDSPKRLSRVDPRYDPASFYRIKAKYLSHWINENVPGNRPIWIWGAGRTSRRRARFLEEKGLVFAGYIDVDPAKIRKQPGRLPVIAPDDIDWKYQPFIIPYVGRRGVREKIKAYLVGKNQIEGKDFILAA